jgi:hypothetical protein
LDPIHLFKWFRNHWVNPNNQKQRWSFESRKIINYQIAVPVPTLPSLGFLTSDAGERKILAFMNGNVLVQSGTSVLKD